MLVEVYLGMDTWPCCKLNKKEVLKLRLAVRVYGVWKEINQRLQKQSRMEAYLGAQESQIVLGFLWILGGVLGKARSVRKLLSLYV